MIRLSKTETEKVVDDAHRLVLGGMKGDDIPSYLHVPLCEKIVQLTAKKMREKFEKQEKKRDKEYQSAMRHSMG